MNWERTGIVELEEAGMIQLGRGKVISKKDLAATPGQYPVYSSAKENDGKFGEYGEYMFDEELITWSVDGGGRLFHRPRHKFSITNVGGFVRILDTDRIDCRYMFYALSFLHGQTSFDWVRKAHPSVIRKVYTDFPLPPLEEQKRIVAVLDQAFAALDHARANAEANLADATELERRLVQTNLSPTSSDSWQTYKLGKVLTVISGFAFKSKEYTEDGHFLVRIANVQDGKISLHRPKFVNLDSKTSKFELAEGDILTSLTGNIGRVAVIREEHLPAALNQRVAKLVPTGGAVSRDFLLQFLCSDLFGDPLRAKGRGAAQQNVSPNEIKNIDINVPDKLQQGKIVDSILAAQQACSQLRRRYAELISDLGELRQSLLQKAFAGELR